MFQRREETVKQVQVGKTRNTEARCQFRRHMYYEWRRQRIPPPPQQQKTENLHTL